MVTELLPGDGPAQVGPVALSAGRRHYSEDDGLLVAWVTVDPVPDAGRTWHALSAAQASTGLVPVLLEPDPPDSFAGVADWPADSQPGFGFVHPVDVTLLDQMSAEDVLAPGWSRGSGDLASGWMHAPFGDLFPGLAPAETGPPPAGEPLRTLAALPPAHLGLVCARRPADVPAIVGWSVFGVDFCNWDDPSDHAFCVAGARSLQIGAVLRSWESRFGARLLRIGADATLQVLAGRPPRSPELALRLAAELFAFADEVHRFDGVRGAYNTVTEIAADLVGASMWEFWWD